jgi:xanthine dehydrogenase large subunit
MANIKDPYHIDGQLHVSGRTKFLLEHPLPAGTLFMAIKHSPVAHGEIININTEAALKIPGVSGVYTYKDIPGFNQIGAIALDEPLLPEKEILYIGQPVAIVVCDDESVCKRAVDAIELKIKELKPILTIDDAEAAGTFFDYRQKVERGKPGEEFGKCDFVLEDVITGGAQDHMYLETQRVLAVPDEGNHFTIYPATQSPTEIQTIVARVLGLQSKDITVDVKRLGGAFGGKERKATIFASLASLAAYHTRRPVAYIMSRQDDMRFTGKRHPFRVKYK